MNGPADRPAGRRPTERDLARLGGPPGLCATCRHAAVLASRSSVFLRCGLADRNPAFPRYPRLPVVACQGYERLPEEGIPT